MFILAIKDERGALVSEHRLEGPQLTIGRVDDCDIVLRSTGVSRQHACFFVEQGRAYVSDMGSANGVYVDEQRIRGDVAIDEQSRIRIAEFLLQIEEMDIEAASTPGISTAVVAPDHAHGKLLVLSGNDAGREVLLYEPLITIGRIEENDVCIYDNSVSRHHARLQYQDDNSYVVQDLESSNGVHMMGRRITRPIRLVHGDRLMFGNVECLISKPDGLSRVRRGTRRWIIYGLLAIAAATLGAVASLMIMRR